MANNDDLQRVTDGEIDLSSSDLQNANLKRRDLRGRNFAGSNIAGAEFSYSDLRDSDFTDVGFVNVDFTGADLRGIKFDSLIAYSKVSGANLSGVRFRRGVSNVDFNGADIRGADFSDCSFSDNVSFDGAIYDASTNFEGARGMRYLGRSPALKDYILEGGKFRRRTTSDVKESTVDEGHALTKNDGSRNDEPGAQGNLISIQRKLIVAPQDAKLMAANLSAALDAHKEILESRKPNEPTELEGYNELVALLAETSSGLKTIAQLLEKSGKDQEVGKDNETGKAARMIADLAERLESYLQKNGEVIVGQTLTTGLIGMSSAFFVFCGAPGPMAFATAATIIGGKPVVRAVGQLLKNALGK